MTKRRVKPEPRGRKASVPSRGWPDKASHAQLSAILDTAVEGIVVIDDRGRIELFNRAAQYMFGYGLDEVLGRNISMLMPQPFRAGHDRYIQKYLRTGRAVVIGVGRDALGLRKDGGTFPIELAIGEVRVGRRLIFTGYVKDVTERKRLEKEVLEIRECEHGRLGQDLHDGVCQELAGIAFHVQTLQHTLSARGAIKPKDISRVATLLQSAIRRARRLSHGLLPVDCSPDGLCVALGHLAAHTTDVSQISCHFRCKAPVPIHNQEVGTHLYRMAQDAVRYALGMGGATRIQIELTARRNGVTLSISDDGINRLPDDRLRANAVLRVLEHRAGAIGARVRGRSVRSGGVCVSCEIFHPRAIRGCHGTQETNNKNSPVAGGQEKNIRR